MNPSPRMHKLHALSLESNLSLNITGRLKYKANLWLSETQSLLKAQSQNPRRSNKFWEMKNMTLSYFQCA